MMSRTSRVALVAWLLAVALAFIVGLVAGQQRERGKHDVQRFTMEVVSSELMTGFRLDHVTGEIVLFGLPWESPKIVVDDDEAKPITRAELTAQEEKRREDRPGHRFFTDGPSVLDPP